jgi:hypothetical protein
MYGTVRAPTWFAAREEAERKFRVARYWFVLLRMPDLPSLEGNDQSIAIALGLYYFEPPKEPET